MVSLEEILAQQAGRDQRDECREVGALKPADDAILLDTSALTIEEVVERMEATVRDR
jgi:cytidylate kinase